MPIMDGFETTKIIRNVLKMDIPIIGFSAGSSDNEIDYCIEIGMNDYIIKSFGNNTIYEKLMKFLNSKNSPEDTSEDLSQNNNISLHWKKKVIMENKNNLKEKQETKIDKDSIFNNVNKSYKKLDLSLNLK